MSKKILIVDDEPFIRSLLKRALEELEDQGVELLLAGDGSQALDLAVDKHPDLIFLDVMMPNIDGYEVCQRVKEMDEDIYIILLTAKGQVVDKDRGMMAGADEYVTKPFNPDHVIEQAATVLGLDL